MPLLTSTCSMSKWLTCRAVQVQHRAGFVELRRGGGGGRTLRWVAWYFAPCICARGHAWTMFLAIACRLHAYPRLSMLASPHGCIARASATISRAAEREPNPCSFLLPGQCHHRRGSGDHLQRGGARQAGEADRTPRDGRRDGGAALAFRCTLEQPDNDSGHLQPQRSRPLLHWHVSAAGISEQ